MTGASAPGGRSTGAPGGGAGGQGHPGGHGSESRDLWPRDFGRDGVSGLVTLDRAMRARDVSRPRPQDEQEAAKVIESLLARAEGRRG